MKIQRQHANQEPPAGNATGALLEKVVEFYAQALQKADAGLKHLQDLKLADSGLTETFTIGYCDGTLTPTLPTRGRTRDQLHELGILTDAGTEYFQGCLIFPIFDSDGALVGLAGVDPRTNKELLIRNCPTGFWNSRAFKNNGHVLLADSIIDGLSLYRAGYVNVAAVISAIQPGDTRLLKGLKSAKITLFADNERTQCLHSLLPCELRALPDHQTPHQGLVSHGPEALADLVENTPGGSVSATLSIPTKPIENGFSVRFDNRQYELRGIEKTARRLKAVVRAELAGKPASAGRFHVDTVDFYSARSRKTLREDVSRFFSQPADLVDSDILRIIKLCEQHNPAMRKEENMPTVMLTDAERREAEALGKSPDIISIIKVDYLACGLIGEEANKLLCYLAAVSRKTEDPLSVLILSSSGAGKSALQDMTLELCPPEDVVKLTSLTGKALFYKGRTSLKHKILALEEDVGAPDAAYAIRNLISAGELVIETTVKDLGTGRMTTMENRVEGPTAVFLTTTNPEPDPETKSRFFVTSIDESREQTRAILDFQRKRHMQGGQSNRESILKKHRNFQRILKCLPVLNPLADQLVYADDRLQSRRDQPKYLNLIKAVTFLRQMIKPLRTKPDGTEYIESDLDDIRIANELADELLGQSLDDLNHVSRDLLFLIERMVSDKESERRKEDPESRIIRADIVFSRRDIREYTGWPHARIERYLKQLVDMEYVLIQSGRFGKRYAYQLAYAGEGKDGGRFLLGVAEIPQPSQTSSVPSRHLLSTFSRGETAQVTQEQPVTENLPRN